MKHDHKKGKIKDNAMAALVRSPMYRQQKHKNKAKDYKRNPKHKKPLGDDYSKGFFTL